jgi:hypothetical protein
VLRLPRRHRYPLRRPVLLWGLGSGVWVLKCGVGGWRLAVGVWGLGSGGLGQLSGLVQRLQSK